MKKQKVIITGKNYSIILAIARSLKNYDYEIIVFNTTPKKNKFKIKTLIKLIINGRGIDAASKYIDKYVYIGDNKNTIINTLISDYNNEDIKPIIIPVDDYSTSIFDSDYERLSKYFILPNIKNKENAINELLDKNNQKKLAIKNNLNVSKGTVLTKENGKYSIPNNLNYPVFTKPEISIKGNKTFMKKCDNKEELKNLLNSIPNEFDCPIIVEEYIYIEKEYAIIGFSYNGKIYIPGIVQMIESGKDNQLGVTLLGQTNSLKNYKNLISNIEKLIKEVGFNGLFDVDIFESNNKYYFSELNFRFGASGYAMTKVGFNIPQIYVNYILNNEMKIDSKVPTKTFVNEKVLLEDFSNGFINYKNYCQLLEKADFGFINDNDDVKPYHRFEKLMFIQRIKKLFH